MCTYYKTMSNPVVFPTAVEAIQTYRYYVQQEITRQHGLQGVEKVSEHTDVSYFT